MEHKTVKAWSVQSSVAPQLLPWLVQGKPTLGTPLEYLVFCDKGDLVPPMYDAHGPVSAPIFDNNSNNFDIVSAILSGDWHEVCDQPLPF